MIWLCQYYSMNKLSLTKLLEKKLDCNNARMPSAVLNKSWKQHPSKMLLYRHLPPVSQPILVRRTRHTWCCWRSMDEFISVVLLLTPKRGYTSAGHLTRANIYQLCANTECSLEERPKAIADRDGWQERERTLCYQHDLRMKKVMMFMKMVSTLK